MTFEEWWASQIGKTFPGPKECFEAGREQGREEARLAALEQRCERGTPWDLAIMAVDRAIRALGDEGGRK